ncbi:DUF1329 domain-containing protein [Undibacterium arcticum]
MYADILKTGHVNPDYMRYELHRVWVLEGTLKDGYRHQYAKRVMYLDEDTWHAVMSDNYDARGQLWRMAMVNYIYAYEMQAFQARVSVYHDLTSGAYMADRLNNERREKDAVERWWPLPGGVHRRRGAPHGALSAAPVSLRARSTPCTVWLYRIAACDSVAGGLARSCAAALPLLN